MYNEIPHSFYRESVKQWNMTAKDCFEIDSDCSRCFIYHTYFKGKQYRCYMGDYVNYLLNKIGRPD